LPPLPATALASSPAPPVAARRSFPPEDGLEAALAKRASQTEEAILRALADSKTDMRAAIRTGVEEALAPVARAVMDLTAAVERDRRERIERDTRAALERPRAASRPSIPPQDMPVAFPIPSPAAARAPSVRPVQPSSARAPSFADIKPSAAEPESPPIPTIPPARVSVGELPTMFDGGRRRRRMKAFAVFFVLLVVVGIGALTIYSRSI
jgi:hypothetical protein